jgi:peptidoglycan/LPS O-acetylase OafA/YrhL
LPSLDGTRGVAILLVLASHFGMIDNPWLSVPEWIVRLGDFGVKIFFVLSGFLITTLLVNEYRRTGHIAIGRFVIRRAFRIFPAAYVFMFTIVAAAALGWVHLPPGAAAFALTYTTNFNTAPGYWLGHTWSLSVEEQFYLLWPLALLLARPRGRAYVAVATLIAAPIARGVIVTWFPGLAENMERAFVTAADGFAAGSLLALVRPRLERHAGYVRWLRAWWAPCLLPLALAVNNLQHHPLAFYVLLQPFVYVVLALGLHRGQMIPEDPLGRMLNWRPLAWVGSISYSLYLWQQAFLVPSGGGVIHRFPIDLLLSVGVAWASYRLIERPCLHLRDRWWPARSTASGPIAAPAASEANA